MKDTVCGALLAYSWSSLGRRTVWPSSIHQPCTIATAAFSTHNYNKHWWSHLFRLSARFIDHCWLLSKPNPPDGVFSRFSAAWVETGSSGLQTCFKAAYTKLWVWNWMLKQIWKLLQLLEKKSQTPCLHLFIFSWLTGFTTTTMNIVFLHHQWTGVTWADSFECFLVFLRNAQKPFADYQCGCAVPESPSPRSVFWHCKQLPFNNRAYSTVPHSSCIVVVMRCNVILAIRGILPPILCNSLLFGGCDSTICIVREDLGVDRYFFILEWQFFAEQRCLVRPRCEAWSYKHV